MPRKGKHSSFDQRQLVIFHYEKGNLSKSTVSDIINLKEDRALNLSNKMSTEIVNRTR